MGRSQVPEKRPAPQDKYEVQAMYLIPLALCPATPPGSGCHHHYPVVTLFGILSIAFLNHGLVLQLSDSVCINAFKTRAVWREGLLQSASASSQHRLKQEDQAYLINLATYVEIRNST